MEKSQCSVRVTQVPSSDAQFFFLMGGGQIPKAYQSTHSLTLILSSSCELFMITQPPYPAYILWYSWDIGKVQKRF
jgi:hypothetical protein